MIRKENLNTNFDGKKIFFCLMFFAKKITLYMYVEFNAWILILDSSGPRNKQKSDHSYVNKLINPLFFKM